MPLEVAEVALRVTRFLNPIGFENPKYMRSELSTTNMPKRMRHANCDRFHKDVVRMLLSVDGIDPNRANVNKTTPVGIASYMGHLEIVRLLLTLPGLDITTEDKWGDAPEASARKQGHTAIASLLREHAAAAPPAE